MALPAGREARDYRLFVAASVLLGLGACVNSSAFNNYLKDVFSLDMARRTFLEFPRELPGFLVSLFVATLALLGEVRIAMVANLAAAAGMMALGWIPSSYILMVSATFVYSAGTHIYMPLANAIGMGFAAEGKEGSVLGKVQSATTLAVVLGSAGLLALFYFAHLSYRAAFSAGAVAYLAAALAFLAMSPRRAHAKPPRLVIKKEYSRYYLISILWGARKQLFITFGPWMLVDLFGEGREVMTLLFFVVSVLGIGLGPAVGKLTDRFGPRTVLAGEAFATIGICLAYGFAPGFLPKAAAAVVVMACYVLDQSSSSVSITRAIYAKQMVKRPEELSSTLSVGISIDHIVSMFLPMLGSLAWLGSPAGSGGAAGYRVIFLCGAGVAFLNFLVTRGMPRKG
jgi:MFS family permease